MASKRIKSESDDATDTQHAKHMLTGNIMDACQNFPIQQIAQDDKHYER